MEILTLGEKIRRRRKSLRLTLKDVAGESVTPAQLSYVESDKCKPSTSLLKYICSKIDLDVDYVLESESEQAKKYCDYYMKEYEFYVRRGEYEEAEGKLLNVERLAEEYGLDRYMAIISYKKGMYFIEKGDNDWAQNNFLTALQVFMKLGDGEYKADCYYNLGQIAIDKNCADDALVFFTDAFELVQNFKTSDHLRLYKINLALAKTYLKMGEFQECEKRIYKAIKEAREYGDDMIAAKVLQDAALMLYSPSKLPQCDEYINEALKIFKDNMHAGNISRLLALKAYIHTKHGDYHTGKACLKDLLKEENGNNDMDTLKYLLKTVDLLLNNGQAIYAGTILESIKGALDGRLAAEYLYLKAKACKGVDDAKFREYLEKSMGFLRKINSRDMLIKVTNAMGESYMLEKNYSQALEYLIESAKLYTLEVI